jgi:hypothetical protein
MIISPNPNDVSFLHKSKAIKLLSAKAINHHSLEFYKPTFSTKTPEIGRSADLMRYLTIVYFAFKKLCEASSVSNSLGDDWKLTPDSEK